MMLLALTAIEVLNLVAGAEERQQELRARYVYREVQENWRIDPYGRRIDSTRRTKTFDVILIHGQRYRKLIERNGLPLTAAEQWEIEEDMKRVPAVQQTQSSIRDLAITHQLAFHDNTIEAKTESKSHRITFDPETHAVLKQVTESAGARTTIEYSRMPDGTYLPHRIETDFTVGDVHGLQISTFSDFKPN